MRVMILRGASGSGKSTYAKGIAAAVKAGGRVAHIVSADDFFMVGDFYQFDPSKLAQAHGQALRHFVDILSVGLHVDTIIVDNTNTTIVEMAPYYALASAYGADLVEIVTLEAPAEVCKTRNVHSVPDFAIERQLTNIERQAIPSFWKAHQLTIPHNGLQAITFEPRKGLIFYTDRSHPTVYLHTFGGSAMMKVLVKYSLAGKGPEGVIHRIKRLVLAEWHTGVSLIDPEDGPILQKIVTLAAATM